MVGGRVLGSKCEPALNQATSQRLEAHEVNLAGPRKNTSSTK